MWMQSHWTRWPSKESSNGNVTTWPKRTSCWMGRLIWTRTKGQPLNSCPRSASWKIPTFHEDGAKDPTKKPGHQGELRPSRTPTQLGEKKKLLPIYWWTGMDKDIDEQIKGCPRCQIRKKGQTTQLGCNWWHKTTDLRGLVWTPHHVKKDILTIPAAFLRRSLPYQARKPECYQKHRTTGVSANTEWQTGTTWTKQKSSATSSNMNSRSFWTQCTLPQRLNICSSTA